jgi:acyl-CoA dehydrogenase
MSAPLGDIADRPIAPPPPDSRGRNFFTADRSLQQVLTEYMDAALLEHLRPTFERLGRLVGDRLDDLASAADRNPPVLHHRDRRGADRQSIEKHPAYREMEQLVFGELGLAAMSHRGGVLGWPERLPPIAKYALTYLFVQSEFGLCCPLSMTDALTRTLAKYGEPGLVARYLPALTAQDLDALLQGAMFMTEQGAGSDVGATATVARHERGAWRLYGEKWFCSNADADLALLLARPEGAGARTRGLGLFLLPRDLPDGSRNAYRIIRLKEKLGTRSMASGETRLDGAIAYPVGDLAKGFLQMTEMINLSRLSNGMRAAGLMRRAATEACVVAEQRIAFGRRLDTLPLMRRQLLKIMLPGEAALSFMCFTADRLGRSDAGDAAAASLVRILTPLLKFRACRDARRVTGDAMEVRGGCGYIEEWIDPRLVRDAHLGSIWEGTSNVVALDVLRAARKEGAHRLLADELRRRLTAAPDLPDALRRQHAALLDRAAGFVDAVQAGADERLARQGTSLLYHAASAALFAIEGASIHRRTGDARRLLLAELVVQHRLRVRDPFASGDAAWEEAIAEALLGTAAVPLARALALCEAA